MVIHPESPMHSSEADGIILATTIEWLGIGGYMQQFLDAFWLYGDKEKISHTYMHPIVMSTTYGEREGELTLMNAWEIFDLLGNGPVQVFRFLFNDQRIIFILLEFHQILYISA